MTSYFILIKFLLKSFLKITKNISLSIILINIFSKVGRWTPHLFLFIVLPNILNLQNKNVNKNFWFLNFLPLYVYIPCHTKHVQIYTNNLLTVLLFKNIQNNVSAHFTINERKYTMIIILHTIEFYPCTFYLIDPVFRHKTNEKK